MFPAGAGMNRSLYRLPLTLTYVPRRRGDEPETIIGIHAPYLCSPQARG